jgi:mono/diheme cytochrome c family protein
MRPGLAAIWVVTLGLACVAVLPSVGGSPAATATAAGHGRRIFAQDCASCHDVSGTGFKSGPVLKGYYHGRQPHSTDSAVRALLKSGKGKMPAFKALSDSQTGDLIAYLKTL